MDPENSWLPVRVLVKNNEIISVKFVVPPEIQGGPEPDRDQYMTLTEMFGYVWNHYENNVAKLDVEYDATYGFIKKFIRRC